MPDRKNNFHFADLFSSVKRDFSKNLSTLLIFDIFFKIIATAIFGPASAWIFNRLVSSSGAWVIGNEQIISFLLSPVGMTAAIISGALALAITFAEQAGIILIASRFNAGQKITAYQALLQMLKYLRVLIGLGLRQVIIGTLYLAPLAAIAAIAFYRLSSQQDLNYLLVEKPPAYWIGTAIAAVLGICALLVIALLYIRWIFSVPFCVLEGQKSARALRYSRNLVRGNFWRVSAVVLGWASLVIGVGVLSTFLFEILGEFILNRVAENLAFIVIVVCILLGLYGLIAVALTFIGFTTSCLVTTRLYYDFGKQNGLYPAIAPLDDSADKSSPPSQPKIVWAAVILALMITTISSVFIINP